MTYMGKGWSSGVVLGGGGGGGEGVVVEKSMGDAVLFLILKLNVNFNTILQKVFRGFTISK